MMQTLVVYGCETWSLTLKEKQKSISRNLEVEINKTVVLYGRENFVSYIKKETINYGNET